MIVRSFLIICSTLVAFSANLFAGSVNGGVSVTIVPNVGGVGAVVIPSVEEGQVVTTSGDPVASPITNTFRPLSTAVAPVFSIAAPGTSNFSTQESVDAAAASADESSGDTGSDGAATERPGSNQQSARSFLGGGSAVAVSGVPNQAYAISLPGKITYLTGTSTVSIDGFSHDAGSTPSVDPTGRSVFNLDVKVSDQPASGQAVQDTIPTEDANAETVTTDISLDTATGPAALSPTTDINAPLSAQAIENAPVTPITTRPPFVDITVSYY